jgi:uncharacterized protein
MMPIRFDWDFQKARQNLRKHHVSFEEASTVFVDQNARLTHDLEHSDEEDRFVLLGFSDHFRLLVVCHAYKESDRIIRIISARRAHRGERLQYGSFL